MYPERRTLFDKETLNKVGKLHGATYGVFGSIKPGNGGQMVLECSLVQLESGQHLVSTSIVCTREEDLKLRSQQLADRLCKLCEVKILTPLRLAKVPVRTMFAATPCFFPSRGLCGSLFYPWTTTDTSFSCQSRSPRTGDGWHQRSTWVVRQDPEHSSF